MAAREIDDWTAALSKVRHRIARARAAEAAAKADAVILAEAAIADGLSERLIAELLGVNRMSLRAWLGKQSA